MPRQSVPNRITIQVLTEAGYRCAVPTCRTILAIDIHHIVEVSEGGGNEIGNLLALCPTCHALYHCHEISRDSIYAWKSMLVSLSHAFDQQTMDDLLFLATPTQVDLRVSGDGVLKFTRLIGSGLATYSIAVNDGRQIQYRVTLTRKGVNLVEAWRSGNRALVSEVLGSTSS